jgi:starvation-inducible outer membrane lipoprotein
MKWIVTIFITGISLALFTGCQTEEEQVQHTQDRKQDMLMKQMQKQQEQAQKLSQ